MGDIDPLAEMVALGVAELLGNPVMLSEGVCALALGLLVVALAVWLTDN